MSFSENTKHLKLPYVMPSQAQKHVTINEAFRLVDTALYPSILSASVTNPPASPAEGDCYIVAENASGPWQGHANDLVRYVDGAWLFIPPWQGFIVYVASSASLSVFDGNTWSDFASGSGGNSFTTLSVGGAQSDTTNRLATKAPASLFDHDGSDHRMKINRHSNTDTVSAMFQTGYQTDAEIGMIGGSTFAIKVRGSDDNWREALTINPETAAVTLPHTNSGGVYLRIASGSLDTAFSTATMDWNAAAAKTGLKLTVTPSSIQSSFELSIGLLLGGNWWISEAFLRIYRDDTPIWPSATGKMRARNLSNGTYSDQAIVTPTMQCVDTPATTAPITYEVRLISVNGNPVHLNRSGSAPEVIFKSSIIAREF